MTVVPRVSRQHRLIEELRICRRQMTGTELAATLGVSTRTLERDVSELQAAGLRIRARRGPNGGYRFESPAHLASVDFSAAEAAAVVAALVAVGPFAAPAAIRALEKVRDALNT